MNFKDIKAIILVDDKPSYYSDGGHGAALRQSTYMLIFEMLKEEMPNVEKVYLILGDGTFEINDKSKMPIKIEASMFSGNSIAENIYGKVQLLSNDKTTLVLIDYTLNSSIENQNEGKALACDIVSKLTSKNIVKQLYSIAPADKEDRERVNRLRTTCIFDFPMSSPMDAAEEIIQSLDKIDERVM